MSENMRMLNILLPLAVNDYVEEDGGLLVKNVKLLAPGEWTDSAVRTPLYYTPKALAKDATNWVATGYWARHSGGFPRNTVTDYLGEVKDMRWDPTVDNGPELERGAVMGSVFYDCLSQVSKDGATRALARAKQGKPLAVSVEHGGRTSYNRELKREETESIFFGGLAQVDQGACRVCSLPRANESDTSENLEKEKETKEMEKAELDKALADFQAGVLAEVDKRLSAIPAPGPDKEMGAALEATKAELAAVTERLKALEMDPQPKSKVETKEKELEDAPAVRKPRIGKGYIECE